MAKIKYWKKEIDEKNQVRWYNTKKKTWGVYIVNSKFDYVNPVEGWSVYYRRSNRRRFKDKSKAINFAESFMKKHPKG